MQGHLQDELLEQDMPKNSCSRFVSIYLSATQGTKVFATMSVSGKKRVVGSKPFRPGWSFRRHSSWGDTAYALCPRTSKSSAPFVTWDRPRTLLQLLVYHILPDLSLRFSRFLLAFFISTGARQMTRCHSLSTACGCVFQERIWKVFGRGGVDLGSILGERTWNCM